MGNQKNVPFGDFAKALDSVERILHNLKTHNLAPPHVVASPPKMRPLVTAVGQFLAERRSHHIAENP